jgi:glucuronate isomerase
MKKFMDEDFLLHSKPAKKLYHDYAKEMPIIDFHSHLPPSQVADDTRFENIAGIWLGGDHYKWRAMRANGVNEEYITGKASDYEKFLAWARTVPQTIGNPLYHWTHIELQRYFGITKTLDESSAREIWEKCNEVIATPEFSVRNLLKKMNVRVLCTTDDPIDDLGHHKLYAAEIASGKAGKFPVLMVPAYRPDKAVKVNDPSAWNDYIEKLQEASGVKIGGFADLIAALEKRHQDFHDLGCRLSDHALEKPFAAEATESELDASMAKLRTGKALDEFSATALKTAILLAVGRMNAARGWTMQLHLGAIRDLNSRMFAKLGPDTGYDAIGDEPIARPLARFLDMLEREGKLPRTILYTLNPACNETICAIMGCFQDGSVPGKIQFGSAWWFNDQLDGMLRQLTALANIGLLSRFVGMLTDSRSFLSFPRHEYFRRLLCNLFGGWVENGEAPEDYRLLGEIVQDICFNNAHNAFDIPGVKK